MTARAPREALFIIGGFNGLKPVQAWIRQLHRNSKECIATAYSWRDAQAASRDILALPKGMKVTLVGHSLGGGKAESIARSLPSGSIDNLITVASFASPLLDDDLVRHKVGFWLNILSAPTDKSWQVLARNFIAPLLLGHSEKGFVSSASENYISHYGHHDFYKLITDRCGAAERGHFSIERRGD